MKSHIGERRTTKKGLTAELKKWKSRERVQVEILETGECIWMPYMDFRKRRFEANTFMYPVYQVPLRHAVPITAIIIISIIAVIGGLLYWLTA